MALSPPKEDVQVKEQEVEVGVVSLIVPEVSGGDICAPSS